MDGTDHEKLRAMLDEEETLLLQQLATDGFLTPLEEEEVRARLRVRVHIIGHARNNM